ncbi:hypothetical protein BJ875DRAFT_508482 [Amylocarpus encephaloides]|uniref:Uncharacterized protein n=1 Tax=Amylocarpus encephaloides TaxID=45428 RepID=A0A9P7Y7F0_9HELO|nr:hypothetical protein BJ875DRAFT_508482 [Amylocarpus encephaloides]
MLTERALKEFDRRNTQPAPSAHRSLYRRSCRPVTRRAVAEWKDKEENWESTQPARDFLTRCSAGRLEEIKLLARHGGPDLSDLRGVRIAKCLLEPALIILSLSSSRGRKRNSTISSNTKPTTNTTTTRNTRPYDRDFQQNLIDGGAYPDEYEYPDGRVLARPDNWEEINQRLAQPRPSLSPSQFSDDKFRKYKRADTHAFKEDQVTKSVILIIEGEITDAKCVSGNILFTNLDHLIDGTLVPGNPDLYYGARPEQLNRQHDLPIVPNFFLAAKGPDGSIAVAGRQASYDGALGARGMHSLQSYGQDEPTYDNSAYTITSIYHGGQLKMYTSHPAQPSGPGSRPEYYMTQINTWGMTGNAETFRRGATAFRNARDWTKEQRDEAIRYANDRANDLPSTTPTESSTTQIEASYMGETAYQDSLASNGLTRFKSSRGRIALLLRYYSLSAFG